MSDSIHLGRIRGITIRLHYTVLLILGFLLLLPGPGVPVVLGYASLLMLIVLLHELGHSLVAQRFGLRVVDITFWPLGGMARMSQIPENSRIEGWIAIAGPLVNFALAALALPFALLPGLGGEIALLFLGWNLVIGLFNLLPAFPMDGGRVLRAWFGRSGDWLRATERAVRVSRIVAALMLVAAFVYHPILALVALFVWWTGSQELYAVRVRHQGPPALRVGPFGFLWPVASASAAQSPAEREARAVARCEELAREPRPVRDGPELASDRNLRARRPAILAPPTERARGSDGWSAEDVELLERFPGSLRRPRTES